MLITWREDKYHRNIRKHGLDFRLVEHVVADPFAVTLFDRYEDGEERWHTVGTLLTGASFKVLVVVHIYPEYEDDTWIHVISLRPADHAERRRYELSHL
jgi:uncharacterized DUF497 family protein